MLHVIVVLQRVHQPQHFLAVCEALITTAARFINDLAATLIWRAFEVMRAAAIALYAVFMALADVP